MIFKTNIFKTNVLNYNLYENKTPLVQTWHVNVINKRIRLTKNVDVKYSSRQIVPYSELVRNTHENQNDSTTIVIEIDVLNHTTAINNDNTVTIVQNINPEITRAILRTVNINQRQDLGSRTLLRRRSEDISENISEANQIVRNPAPETVGGEEKLIEKIEEISREQKIAYEGGCQFEEMDASTRFPYPQFNNITYERLGLTIAESRFRINEIYCHFNVIKHWLFSTINRHTHTYIVPRPNNIQEQLIMQQVRRLQDHASSINIENILTNLTEVLIKAEGCHLLMIMTAILTLIKMTYVSQIPVRVLTFVKRNLNKIKIKIKIHKLIRPEYRQPITPNVQNSRIIEIIKEQTENIEWMASWLLFNKMVNDFIKKWKGFITKKWKSKSI